MPNYYFDPVSGNDANDGLGPYKAAFTSGGTTPIAVGDTVTGGTSGKTAKVVYLAHTSGSWAGGDEAGTIYVGTPSGAFTPGEALLVGGTDLATLTADFAVSSKKTITTGASAALLVPGDNIRIKKSNDPASLGINATFTLGSETVTFASAIAAVISDCESAWTASANVTQSNSTTKKLGTYSQQFVFAAGFSTGKVAYFDFGAGTELDLSAFTAISLWFSVSASLAPGMFRIDLCSDASGDTPIDAAHQFTIAEGINMGFTSGWNKIHLKKGSALSSSVRSISLHALSDPGTATIRLDNIIACNDLHHQALIGPSSTSLWPVYQVTDAQTVALKGQYLEATAAATPCYCMGDWYSPETNPTGYTTAVMTLNDSGEDGNPLIYSGGWNFLTDAQDGYSCFKILGEDTGYNLYNNGRDYVRMENIRLSSGIATLKTINIANAFEMDNFECYSSAREATSSDDGYIWKLDGVCRFVGSGGGYPVTLVAGNESEWNGDIYCYESGLIITQAGAGANSRSLKMNGIIRHAQSTHGAGVYFQCHAWIRKLQTYRTVPQFGGPWNFHVEEYEISLGSGSLAYLAKAYVDESIGVGGVGPVTIDNVTTDVAVPAADSFLSYRQYMGMFCEFRILSINGDPTRYFGATRGGHWGDHVTMGYAAAWGYGGTGKALCISPEYTTVPTRKIFFAPVVSGETYKLTMQVKKSSSGCNPTMTATITGCGAAAIRDESVTLTDSWAKFSGTSFTPTASGFMRITLSALNGSTTGDIGIDDLRVEKQ